MKIIQKKLCIASWIFFQGECKMNWKELCAFRENFLCDHLEERLMIDAGVKVNDCTFENKGRWLLAHVKKIHAKECKTYIFDDTTGEWNDQDEGDYDDYLDDYFAEEESK